jgi:ribosomal protein S12 methylthiotransferase
VGRRIRALVDEVADGVAIARSEAEAPQIDGVIRIEAGEKNGARLRAGEWADVEITGADAYDLTGRLTHG